MTESRVFDSYYFRLLLTKFAAFSLQESRQLGTASVDSGFHGANRQLQHIRSLFISEFLEISQDHRFTKVLSDPEQRAMNSLGKFTLFERPLRADVARRILFGLLVLDLQRVCMSTFGLEFPVVVDDMIAANPDQPSHECTRFRPVRVQSSIDLQEDFLSQIFGLVKSSREAVRQIVDPLVVLANDVF